MRPGRNCWKAGSPIAASNNVISAASRPPIRQAIAADPALAAAHMGLGVASARSGEPVKARTAFESALRYDPNNVDTDTTRWAKIFEEIFR